VEAEGEGGCESASARRKSPVAARAAYVTAAVRSGARGDTSGEPSRVMARSPYGTTAPGLQNYGRARSMLTGVAWWVLKLFSVGHKTMWSSINLKQPRQLCNRLKHASSRHQIGLSSRIQKMRCGCGRTSGLCVWQHTLYIPPQDARPKGFAAALCLARFEGRHVHSGIPVAVPQVPNQALGDGEVVNVVAPRMSEPLELEHVHVDLAGPLEVRSV
jgi:hypothetical protein